MLTRQLLELVEDEVEELTLPVYLESTMEAVPLYERLGFEKVDGFKMEIPAPRGSVDEEEDRKEDIGGKVVYREVCMVYWPKGVWR